MYFINGYYWETDHGQETYVSVTFHGHVENDTEGTINGDIVDEDGISIFITGWRWNQVEKTLKFLATYCDDPTFPMFYHLAETAPLHFEGVWEGQSGVKEEVRLILTPIPDKFFKRDTKPTLAA